MDIIGNMNWGYIMATPIDDTPILEGDEAVEFLNHMLD